MLNLARIILAALFIFIIAIAILAQSKNRDEMIDIGGRKLHLKCAGKLVKGSATVILEAGAASPSTDWEKVFPGVAKFARVCAYDRANNGASDKDPQPRNAKKVADDLHTLLNNAGEPGPYVLAGHSFGGIYAMLYANQYPKDVVGMVLVDSSHEDQFEKFEAIMTEQQVKESRARRAVMIEGIDTAAVRSELRAAKWRTTIPLYVLAHGITKPEMIPPGWSPEQLQKREAAWQEMQAGHAKRSARGKLIVAKKSGHYIQNDEPELVIDAIKKIVGEIAKII